MLSYSNEYILYSIWRNPFILINENILNNGKTHFKEKTFDIYGDLHLLL